MGKIIENKIPLKERLTKVVTPSSCIENYSSPRINLLLLKKRGNSKTYKGLLIQKMKEARDSGNLDVCQLIQWCYKRYLEFEEHEKVLLKNWKGKSGIKIINNPDYFIVITHQKPDQDSKPVEIKREISKIEVNHIINVINQLNKGKRISTRDIGEKAYKRNWDTIFSDRFLHTNLNLILNILQFYGLTHYRGRFTSVIKEVREIQEVLK